MYKKLLSLAVVVFSLMCVNAEAQNMNTINLGNLIPAGSQPDNIATQLQDGEFWWGYFDGAYDSGTKGFGMGDKSRIPATYIAAIAIPAGTADMEGKTITGVSFTFPNTKNISDVKVWMSNGLPDIAENASICCKNVTDIKGLNTNDGSINEIRFDKPYIIDTSKDVYIGYSFVVTANEGEADGYPLLVKGEETLDNALFVKFGGVDSWWYDYSIPQYEEFKFGNLALRVLINGKVGDNSASTKSSFQDITTAKGCEITVPVEINNLSKDPIKNVTLAIDFGGEKFEKTIGLDNEITGKETLDVVLHAPDEIGVKKLSITVDKVNGQPNQCKFNKMEGNVIVLSRIVDHKVVIEEFTGMWCGWCPKGIVAMEKAKQVYGDNVIIVTIHHNDKLECRDYEVFKNATVGNYPQAHVDRTIMSVDPYYGSSLYKIFGISQDIEKRASVIPVAEVRVADATIDGDVLRAKSDVKFLYTGNADYSLMFVLTENGMESDGWLQANYLTQWKGQPIEDEEPMFEKWINGTSQMSGIVFDDVAIGAIDIESGIMGSVPRNVKAEESNFYEVEFNLRKYKKILDNDQLNVCVFLYDNKTGQIVNADKKSMSTDSAVRGVTSEDENSEEVARFTIDGRRIYVPEKGVNIIKYSDGTTKKIIVR